MTTKVFWDFINERHRVYLKKAAGLEKPWTEDSILQHWKFTNVFRELDRGTVWLRENFIEKHWEEGPLLLFNIAWYRMFNLTDTGEFLGWIVNWDTDYYTQMLEDRQASGVSVFTNAHMTHGKKGESKALTHCKGIEKIWNDRGFLFKEIARVGLLEEAFNVLLNYPCVGKFIAYEIVTDFRHTVLLKNAKDVNTWANVGPGAWRGLNFMFPNMPKENGLWKMIELLEDSMDMTEEHVPEMELRDIEHSLCEFYKYVKIKNGGRGKQRYNGV